MIAVHNRTRPPAFRGRSQRTISRQDPQNIMTTVLEVQNLNSADANAEPVTAAEAPSQSRLFILISIPPMGFLHTAYPVGFRCPCVTKTELGGILNRAGFRTPMYPCFVCSA